MPRTKQTRPRKVASKMKANPRKFRGAALALHQAGHSSLAKQLHFAVGLK